MIMIAEETTEFAIDLESTSDEVAIEYVRSGNTAAFEVIMRRYNQRLYRVARSILLDNDAAQDAVQQAYIAAYYKLDSYTEHTSFSAWLTRITINEALMIRRKHDNRIAENRDMHEADKIAAKSNNPATIHANKELAVMIESAIGQLPEEFRYVFVLRAVQQLSTKETAESLDINEATVKTRLHRARNLMQLNLNEHIEQAGLHVFEFAGQRCDNIVRMVLERLRKS
ncbi:MAG: RNA polymerase sigma factor [Gammaproteobacteria bacterium]|nr:RNA polymerase sigma factor [Gammaproteobacteria bacterium]